MNPYHHLVSEYVRFIRDGKRYPLSKFPPCPRPAPGPDAPKALLFSPHPDDEVIVGALALRLLRQSNWNIVNIAVTHGSNKTRQEERWMELQACCACIGFGLVRTAPRGLEKVNIHTREEEPDHWRESVKVISTLLSSHSPKVIFFPHASDWNSAHIGTHFLVKDALRSLPGFECYVVETEFWRPLESPNLMVEVAPGELGDLMTALTFHVGEVERNPYHLSLPAWMVDNTRRGSELIGGQGAMAPAFAFATLYRVSKWSGGEMRKLYPDGKFLSSADNPEAVFT